MPNSTLYTVDYTDSDATRIIRVAGPQDGAAVADQLERFGFAVMEPTELTPSTQALETLADWLDLGEPYIPLMYRRRADSKPYVYADIVPRADSNHPGFGSDQAQPFHVDGLFDPVGAIRSSMLYCVRPAVEGGRTIVFNASAVFMALREQDPAAAKVLLGEGVLERLATIPDVHGSVHAAAFAYDDSGLLMTRYSDGRTERWHAPVGEEAELDRALSYFRAAVKEPRYCAPIRLGAGQCLIIRNDRLSHAREDFVSDPEQPRHLVRGLYRRAPGGVPAVSGV
ncbi:TauD/TfdA family dioxygenase [Streptomyces sp. NPDC005573]|uniref:TauD/TfdA family dioxygenase n=1 Tax=Streptomyces sp. NPDC005573 TaxID=3156890 RepID=UPI0033AB0E86